MRGPLKKCALRASVLCLSLAFGSAMAQEPEQTHGPIPSVEAATDYVAPPTEPVEPSAGNPAESNPPEVSSTPSVAEELPTPIADEAAAPAEAAAKPEKVKKEKKPREPRESSGFAFAPKIGARAGLGISSFAGHRPLTTSIDGVWAFPDGYYVQLGAWGSTSVGLACEYDLTDIVDIGLGLPLSVAAELQYTLYTAYGSFAVLYSESDYFPTLYEAGVELHALEIPVLARVRINNIYAELGPVFGFNLFAKAYANSDLKRPLRNVFAIGPAIGAGVDIDGILVGFRWNIDAIQYARNSNGYPWALQASVTAYPF